MKPHLLQLWLQPWFLNYVGYPISLNGGFHSGSSQNSLSLQSFALHPSLNPGSSDWFLGFFPFELYLGLSSRSVKSRLDYSSGGFNLSFYLGPPESSLSGYFGLPFGDLQLYGRLNSRPPELFGGYFSVDQRSPHCIFEFYFLKQSR